MLPGGRPPDPLRGPVEHRLAQVDQRDVEVRKVLQQLEGVVPGPAAHVEDVPGVRRRGRCRLGDQGHRQRRIDRGRLAGFEVGEPLHVGVEPLPDFIDRRFHRFRTPPGFVERNWVGMALAGDVRPEVTAVCSRRVLTTPVQPGVRADGLGEVATGMPVWLE